MQASQRVCHESRRSRHPSRFTEQWNVPFSRAVVYITATNGIEWQRPTSGSTSAASKTRATRSANEGVAEREGSTISGWRFGMSRGTTAASNAVFATRLRQFSVGRKASSSGYTLTLSPTVQCGPPARGSWCWSSFMYVFSGALCPWASSRAPSEAASSCCFL